MDTIKNIGIGIKELIIGVAVCIFIKWLVEKGRDAVAKAKDSEPGPNSVANTSIDERKVVKAPAEGKETRRQDFSEKFEGSEPETLDGQEPGVGGGAREGELDEQESEGEAPVILVESGEAAVALEPVDGPEANIGGGAQEGESFGQDSGLEAVSLLPSFEVQPQMKKMATQNQREIDVSILESQLTNNIKVLLSGGIEVALHGDQSDDKLEIIIALLKHSAYANKLGQIEKIHFGFGYSFYEREASVQELFDMFPQFPNLAELTVHHICDQLVTEVHPNCVSKQIADANNLEEYTFCKGKIKLDMATIPNIKSLAFWYSSFFDNYLVEIKESKEPRRRSSDIVVMSGDHDLSDIFCYPDCPSHQWTFNNNLVMMWLLLKKTDTFHAIVTLPGPGITVKEWAEIIEHPLHLEIEIYRNDAAALKIGGALEKDSAAIIKKKRAEWEIATWSREKEERKAQQEREKLIMKENTERAAKEREEAHRIVYQKSRKVREDAINAMREKRAREAQEIKSVQQQEEGTPQNNASQAVDVKKDD